VVGKSEKLFQGITNLNQYMHCTTRKRNGKPTYLKLRAVTQGKLRDFLLVYWKLGFLSAHCRCELQSQY